MAWGKPEWREKWQLGFLREVLKWCNTACQPSSVVSFCYLFFYALKITFVCRSFKSLLFSPSRLFVSTPHTAPSLLLLCLLRPVSALFTGKCHCSAWLEATGPASCPFTSSSRCGESKTMAPLILTGPLVYSQLNGSYNLFRTMMTTRWDYRHCMQLSTVMTLSFSILNRNHWSQRPDKCPRGNSCCAYTIFERKHPFSVLLREIERNTIVVL